MGNLPSNVKDIQDLRAKRLVSAKTASSLVCLNFKVPLQIRQQFKIAAARRDVTMTELLMKLLNDFMNSAAADHQLHELSIKQEIKKMTVPFEEMDNEVR